jgi:hypothetical protein
MNGIVSVNGVVCREGHDYVYRPIDRDIVFTDAPLSGDYISVTTGPTSKVWIGDGFTIRFKVEEYVENQEFTEMVNKTWELRNVPAVAEALEKLKVVVTLADGGSRD